MILLGQDDWLRANPIAGIDPQQRFAVVRCEVCSGRYTSPRLKKEHRALAFPQNYPFYSRAYATKDAEIPRPDPEHLARARAAFASRADHLCEVMPRPGRVLDLGCGDGFFLDVMRARGWEVAGVDVEPAVVWYAREILGLKNVRHADMEEGEYPHGPFDAITLWGSMQLVYEPRKLLERIHRLLAPGGILAIGVSNIRSAGAKTFRGHWYGLGLPRHLVHYTPETLARLIEWTGYRVERTEFETPRWIVAGSVDAAKFPLKKATKAALYSASPLFGRTRLADTMELYARK
jgi:SAM-dependent methyltransferase